MALLSIAESLRVENRPSSYRVAPPTRSEGYSLSTCVPQQSQRSPASACTCARISSPESRAPADLDRRKPLPHTGHLEPCCRPPNRAAKLKAGADSCSSACAGDLPSLGPYQSELRLGDLVELRALASGSDRAGPHHSLLMTPTTLPAITGSRTRMGSISSFSGCSLT